MKNRRLPGSNDKAKGFMATSSRFYQQEVDPVPGPGQYFIKDKPVIGGKFSSNKRKSFFEVIDSPPPGAYNLPSCFNEKKSFSFYPKGKEISVKSPGPADYSPNEVIVNTKKAIFGSEKRKDVFFNRELALNPGPGMYTLPDVFGGPKWGFGCEISRKYASIEHMPGPGAYNSPSTLSQISSKFPTGKRAASVKNTPGPGEYETVRLSKNTAFAISRAEKFAKIEGPVLPGPGEYQIKDYLSMTQPLFSKSEGKT